MTSSKTLVGNEELLMVFDSGKRLRNIVTRENIYDITQNYGWYEGSPGKKMIIFESGSQPLVVGNQQNIIKCNLPTHIVLHLSYWRN